MSSVIAPAILAENAQQYKEQVDRITGFAERVHIDLTDGEFAPTFTVSIPELWAPEGWTIDIHAMVNKLDEYVPKLIALRPHLIIIHAEAEGDVLGALKEIKRSGIMAGLALLRPTVPQTVEELIKEAEHVLIFSGELGKFGGTASLMQLEKIRLVKMINPNVEIGWDGGVMVDNAYSLVQGGVNVLNVGGTIQKATDPLAMFAKLQQEISKTGVLG
jgi:ribulose-phosphate 3-epimerase